MTKSDENYPECLLLNLMLNRLKIILLLSRKFQLE